ncbi:MAG TPA: zinc-binding dehydrogenase [Gaiella sp.]|nr:zinc-binding dehydrogenase [Gaiella sp.]
MRIRAAVLERVGATQPYATSRPLSIEDVQLDDPVRGELLVRIEAAGVCHSDLSVVDGTRPRPVPMVLGHEAAGVVEAVGDGIADVEAGDHVVLAFVPACGACEACEAGRPALCAPAAAANAAGELLGGGSRLRRRSAPLHHHLGVSGFAERAVVARSSAVVVDRDVPLETAALLGCATLTGAGAVLNSAAVQPGESVAVFGLGGVGLAAVMAAVAVGAAPVIAVDPVPGKRALACELGATSAHDPVDAPAAIREETRGGVRYAFEAAGHPRVLEAAYAATERGGTTVSMGLPDPTLQLRLPALSLVAEARTLVGSYMGSSVPQRDVPRFVELWRSGRLPVERLHSATVALDEVNEAMDALAAGEVVRQIVRP